MGYKAIGFRKGVFAPLLLCAALGTTHCGGESQNGDPTCGNDVIEVNELCDNATLAGQTCETQGFFAGTLACNATCDGYDTGSCTGGCGNDVIEANELCDNATLAGQTCETQGFFAGTLGCNTTCDGYDTSNCTGGCGNDVVDDAGELCDGPDVDGQDCTTIGQGFDGGTLGCSAACDAYDVTACTPRCGNGAIEAAEECDGSELAGATCATVGIGLTGPLGCSANCTLDGSGCSPPSVSHINCSEAGCGDFGDVFTVADVNCDGIGDLIVGAYSKDNPPLMPADPFGQDGSVYIHFGTAGGFNSTPDVTIRGDRNARFGFSVAGLGDFTGHGDQCEDVAISSVFWDGGAGCFSGAVHIFRGRSTWNPAYDETSGPDTTILYSPAGGCVSFETLGTRVRNIGDFNNDGRPDLAIAAPRVQPNGAVYILFGTGSVTPSILSAPAEMNVVVTGTAPTSAVAYENLGWSLSGIGSVDGDNFADFLIGAPGATDDAPTQPAPPGKAFIVYGAGGSSQIVDLLDPQGRASQIEESPVLISGTSSLGSAVAGLGDINGDGALDIAIGDPHYRNEDAAPPVDDCGAVFVFLGDGSGFSGNITIDQADLWIRCDADSDSVGRSIASNLNLYGGSLGDLDGDGLPDLAFGMSPWGTADGGVAFVLGDALFPSPGAWQTVQMSADFVLGSPDPCSGWGRLVDHLGNPFGTGSLIGVGDAAFNAIAPCSGPPLGRVTVVQP